MKRRSKKEFIMYEKNERIINEQEFRGGGLAGIGDVME
jgi:hypothetical protein